MACEHVFGNRVTMHCVRVAVGATDEDDATASVIADDVLDEGLHCRIVVEHHAWDAGHDHADAAHRQRMKPLGDPANAGNPAEHAEGSRDQNDAVYRVFVDELVDTVARRACRVWRIEGVAGDDEQVEIEHLEGMLKARSKLAFEAAREVIELIDEHGDGLSPRFRRGAGCLVRLSRHARGVRRLNQSA